MKNRCSNPKNADYKYYGGKGIKVCKPWLNYKSFRTWAHQNGYQRHLTIDRIDSNKHYTPSNCRWATIRQQSNNRAYCHHWTYLGETLTLIEWGKKLGINPNTFRTRLSRGWSIKKILTTPIRKRYSS